MKLHDTHKSYPLALEQLEVSSNMLSNYCKRIQARFKISSAMIQKLAPNLMDKTKYTLHYRNLKIYLDLGLI